LVVSDLDGRVAQIVASQLTRLGLPVDAKQPAFAVLVSERELAWLLVGYLRV
jgi:hypothetical protein